MGLVYGHSLSTGDFSATFHVFLRLAFGCLADEDAVAGFGSATGRSVASGREGAEGSLTVTTVGRAGTEGSLVSLAEGRKEREAEVGGSVPGVTQRRTQAKISSLLGLHELQHPPKSYKP